MGRETESETDRRNVLKGVGAGAVGWSFLAGPTAAERGDTAEEMDCSLDVVVEVGEGNRDNWVRRDYLNDDFRGKIDVSGIQTGGELAYVMVPTSPEGGFGSGSTIRSSIVDTTSSSRFVETTDSSASIVHRNRWNPQGVGPLGTWPSGTYTVYAAVLDGDQDAFGAAISDPFEVEP